MDATSMALCHTKVEEIRRRISEGELTAQQIHDILISEIENELNRPTKEVNMAYVKICEELLSSLGADDEPLVDQYYISNRRSIQKVLERTHSNRRRFSESKTAAVFCLAAVMLFAAVLIPSGRIEITPSADDEQSIVQGHSVQSGTNGVANAGAALDHFGSYNTTDWQEVIRLMGGEPQTPQWIPDGWSIKKYSVDLTDSFSSLSIDYTSEENEKWILYTVCDFSSIDDIYDIIENDEKGLKTVSADGKELFVSDNMDSQSAIWFNDKTEYILSGNIGRECIIQIAESVNYERK